MLVRMTVSSSKKVFLSRKVFLSKKLILQASATFRDAEDWFFFCMSRFDVSQCCKSLVVSLCRRNIFGLSANVRSQNCCCCLDANSLICDRGIMTEGSRKFVPGKK